MTGRSRLAKIANHLTPQQVVLAYLDDVMRRFGSFHDWTESVAGNQAEAPLIRVPKAARENVRNTMGGQPKDVIAKAEEDATRETVFLIRLFLEVTQKLLDDTARYRLQASLCARSMQVMLLREAMREDAEGVDAFRGEESQSSAQREQIQRHLGRLYLHELVIGAVRDNYFDGHPILFPAQARRLSELIETAEALADEYNVFVRATRAVPPVEPPTGDGSPPNANSERDSPIDRQCVRNTATAAVRREVAFVVQMAKAETLVALGWNNEGSSLAAKAYTQRYPKCQ